MIVVKKELKSTPQKKEEMKFAMLHFVDDPLVHKHFRTVL